MKSFALTNKNGFVEQIASSPYNDIKEGDIYNGFTAHELPAVTNADEVLKNWYWDNGWNIRGSHPSSFHFWNVETKIWELNKEQLIAHYKYERDQRLKNSDWTQLPDSPLNASKKAIWAEYRSALRNMTENQYLEGDLPKIPDTMA
jgi:hypothetical protein